MRGIAILLTTPLLMLSACATTSFAPPTLKYDMNFDYGSGLTNVNYGCPGPGAPATTLPVKRDIQGAQQMIDNFVLSYRCAGRQAADGRQFFEVPSFLILTASAAATALGASPDVAIVATGANAVLNAGNAYYVPKEKAAVIDQSLDALLCVKTESVGVDAFTTIKPPPSDDKRTADLIAQQTQELGEIQIRTAERYFDMIASALLQIERATAQQLRDIGDFDARAAASEIEKLIEARNKAKEEGDQQNKMDLRPAAQEQYVSVKLDELQVALQQCVWRAKLG
jgi:hypothetical protein